MPVDAGEWLAYRREVSGAKLRLFCFPFGGGGASIFANWHKGMPAGVEVCPVQLPGRENRLSEPPITRVPHMITLLTDALAPYIDRPFALYGHSIGALAVFELARQFRRQGLRSPEWLFVSGHPSPDLPRKRPAVSHLSRPEFTAAMREHFDVSPALLESRELMDMIYPALRADYELVETYVYQEEPPFDIPFSVFGGYSDPEADKDALLTWRKHATSFFKLTIFDGGHMFINTAREELVGEIAKDLRRLQLLSPQEGRSDAQ